MRPIPEHRLLDLIEWLVSDECHDLDHAGMIAELGQRLRALPLPLDRLTLHLRTLHPEILARVVAWSPDGPLEIYDREHGVERLAAFATSPIRQVIDSREWRTVRAAPGSEVLGEIDYFHGRGIAELVIAPLLTGGGPASAVSFGTRRARGFTPAVHQALKRLLPALRGTCELRLLRYAEATLLDTYVGVATGQRILAGHIRRGDVESLEAALLLCDLRDFTGLSNRLPAVQVLEHLNLYFDQVVPAITTGGGEILKFMGDAVLAFFRHEDGPAASCAVAFGAATEALARLAVTSSPASKLHGGKLQAGIALHHGTVSYGNIGSGRRLDFTVIGPDVNLVSRIQTVCGTTGDPLLMSRFATLLGRPDLRSIGRHELKGFPEAMELFASGEG